VGCRWKHSSTGARRAPSPAAAPSAPAAPAAPSAPRCRDRPECARRLQWGRRHPRPRTGPPTLGAASHAGDAASDAPAPAGALRVANRLPERRRPRRPRGHAASSPRTQEDAAAAINAHVLQVWQGLTPARTRPRRPADRPAHRRGAHGMARRAGKAHRARGDNARPPPSSMRSPRPRPPHPRIRPPRPTETRHDWIAVQRPSVPRRYQPESSRHWSTRTIRCCSSWPPSIPPPGKLVDYIRSLPQRDDLGEPADGPIACTRARRRSAWRIGAAAPQLRRTRGPACGCRGDQPPTAHVPARDGRHAGGSAHVSARGR